MSRQTKKNTNKSKTLKSRPSPSESATSLPEGTIRNGGNGKRWVVKKASNGTSRWVPIESVELNGWKLLTVDDLSKNIDKPITIYTRMYGDMFPKSIEKYMTKIVFTPNGHAQVNKSKTLLQNWLKNKKPSVKPGQAFFVLGKGGYIFTNKNNVTNNDFALQVDSKHPQYVSDNVMTMECFIKL